MEIIIPEFQSAEEKNTLVLIAVATILTGIIAPAVVFWSNKNLPATSLRVVKALLNFEILILIAIVVAGIVPVIGWLIGAFVPLVHIIVTLMVTIAVSNNTEIKVPALVKFIQ